MSQYKEGTRDQLVGFVSGVRANKDGTTRFAIGRKGVRTTFSLPPKDARGHLVENGQHVLVCFTHTSGRKYPRIDQILPNPTGIQIQRVQEWLTEKGSLPV